MEFFPVNLALLWFFGVGKSQRCAAIKSEKFHIEWKMLKSRQKVDQIGQNGTKTVITV